MLKSLDEPDADFVIFLSTIIKLNMIRKPFFRLLSFRKFSQIYGDSNFVDISEKQK